MATTANMSTSNTIDNDNGPDSLLSSFDPATVAIRASSDPNTLQSLETFALELTRYVDLMKKNNGNRTTANGEVDNNNKKSNDDDDDITQNNNHNVSSSTTTRNQNLNGQPQQHHPESANLHMEEHEENVAAYNSNTGEELEKGGTSTSTNSQQKNSGAASFPIVELDVNASSDDDNGQQEQGNPTTLQLEEWSEKEAKVQAPGTGNGASGLLDQEVEEEDEEDGQQEDNSVPPAGRRLVRNGSQLRRSVGLTRNTLNLYLKELGLTAKFGRGAISSRKHVISHLTFQHRWNDMPYDESHVMRWWIATGVNRLRLALPLNPKLQPIQQAIAIFWAEHNKKGGGALCHYVGHFRCVHFKENKRNVEFKDCQRQALLLFEFVHFDCKLASKMADIHRLRVKK